MTAKRRSAKRKQPAARRILPRYELDDDPLTRAQMDAIGRLQPPGRSKVIKELF
jgi:hypothetical protein